MSPATRVHGVRTAHPWWGGGCHTPRLAGSLPSPPQGPWSSSAGSGATTEPQGHLLCRVVASLDPWVHWAQAGWGHPRVLEGPEISSCTTREAVSSSTIKEGRLETVHTYSDQRPVAGLPIRGQSKQLPTHLHPAWGACGTKEAASKRTLPGFGAVSSPPVRPQPCRLTKALSHPCRAPRLGHSPPSSSPGNRTPGSQQGLREGGIPRLPIPEYWVPRLPPGLLTFLPGDGSGCSDRAQCSRDTWGHLLVAGPLLLRALASVTDASEVTAGVSKAK